MKESGSYEVDSIIFQQMPNTLDWKIYIECLWIIYIKWHKLYKKKDLKSDCPLVRYQKSPLDVRREYVEIHKLILRPLLMAESWFLCQYICFWGWGI